MEKLTVDFDVEILRLKSIFTEVAIGTVARADVYAEYILTKAKEITPEISKEVETAPQDIEGIENKGWTSFHKDDNGSFFIYNYMIKGAIKASLEKLQAGKALKTISAYKKWVGKLIEIEPRKLSSPDFLLNEYNQAKPIYKLGKNDYYD